MNAMERAIVAAAEYGGAPPTTYEVGPEADFKFDGATVSVQLTAWTNVDVAAGRGE